MQTYREYLYHFVWATKGRNPFITEWIEPRVHEYIRCKCVELKVHLYAVNGMPDHVHLACSLPTVLSVSVFMKAVKGGAAHFVNHLPEAQAAYRHCLYWQPGFGGMTVTQRDLPRLVSYVDHQKQHHTEGSLLARLERVPPVPQGLSFLEE